MAKRISSIGPIHAKRAVMTDITSPDSLPLDGAETTDDCILNGQIRVRQPRDGYRIGTDAIMLAATIQMKSGRLLDMGAGVGGVCLAVAHRLPGINITAVEIDPVSHHLLEHNIAQNEHATRIRPLLADVLSLPPVMAGAFDNVVSNPPFHHYADSPARSRRRALAHYETDERLRSWIDAGLAALKPKGRLSVIVRADRGDMILAHLREQGAGEIALFPLWSYQSSPAIRLVITARKAVKGVMALLPGLVLHNSSGALTQDAQKVMKGDGVLLIHPAASHLS